MLNFIKSHKKTTAFSFLSVLFLLACFFSRPLTYLALDFYDAYITPYNGQCAYRVLNNSCSCSEFFRNIVDKQGVFPAVLAMPKQFYRCNLAFKEIKLRAQEGGSGGKKKRDADDWCCLGCKVTGGVCCIGGAAAALYYFFNPDQEELRKAPSEDVSDKWNSTDNESDNNGQLDLSRTLLDTRDDESDIDEEDDFSLPLLEPEDE